ncbi:MAG: hypothetical protein AB1744_09155, partial [Candidatus Zixiibacteriota bacterium]
NSISLEADLDDPVNVFIPQWVFVQAFDMEGLGSEIVFRLFSRNDHPPNTRILPFDYHLPYVDGDSGGIVTGVKHAWIGQDPIDYPGKDDAPPFEFHWRLYGPYTDTVAILQRFISLVLVTDDARLYHMGDTIIRCDTTFGDSITVSCTTVVVDSTSGDLVWADTTRIFAVDDTSFVGNDTFDVVVDSSFDGIDCWVNNTGDTIYNVFDNDPFPSDKDTTLEKWFIFWVRARDDALVADLTPAFAMFPVISPRYERGVGVIDLTSTAGLKPNQPSLSVRKEYWTSVIRAWDDTLTFDPVEVPGQPGLAPDYVVAKVVISQRDEVPMSFILKHKVLILYDDAIHEPLFRDAEDNIYKGIDAGVNVLAMWRAPYIGGPNERPNWGILVDLKYRYYFGVEQLVYSGWFCHAFPSCGEPNTGTSCSDMAGRIEDFVGAYAIDSINWPNLEIDSVLIRTRYQWGPFCGLAFRIPALPEVDWSIRTTQTDVLYLYKSYYGSRHPFGTDYNMEGNPVAHRLTTYLFRTAHFNFTPLAIDSVQMQQVIDRILTWLYPADLSSPTAGIRYPDAGHGLSVSEARRAYWQRNEENADKENEETGFEFYLYKK